MWAIRFATVRIFRERRFALVIIAQLSLGIALATAVFAVANHLLLRDPPGVANAGDLRRLYLRSRENTDQDVASPRFGFAQYRAIAEAAANRVSLAAYTPPDSFALDIDPNIKRLRVSYATASYFSTLGVLPALGRFYSAAEDSMGIGSDVAVISHRLWTSHFGADQSLLGRTLPLRGHNGQRPIVIGIAPAQFAGIDLDVTDVWLPMASRREENGDIPWYRSWITNRPTRVVARLADGDDARWLEAVATTALRRGGNPIEDLRRERRPDSTATVLAGAIQETLAPTPQPSKTAEMVRALLACAIVLMLITAANVANLMLTRSINRRRQAAIKVALGIPRTLLLGEVIAESVALFVVAGLLALSFAGAEGGVLSRWIVPSAQLEIPWFGGRLVLFALGLALVAAILASLPSALTATRANLHELLSSAGGNAGYRRSGLRSTLLVLQTALSLFLLVGAGLFARSLARLRDIDLGYDVDRLTFATAEYRAETGVFWTGLGEGRGAELSDALKRAGVALQRSAAVEAVAYASNVPMSGFQVPFIKLPGREIPLLHERPAVSINVSDNYFAVTGMSLVRGRNFSALDRGGAPVVIVNENAARLYWPDQDPIGQCITMTVGNIPCRTVVGVVQNQHLENVLEKPWARIYVPLSQSTSKLAPGNAAVLIVRNAPSAEIEHMIRVEMQRVLPDAERIVVKPLADQIDSQLHAWRMGTALFSGLAVFALAVAAFGVYTVTAYQVSQRKRELAIRLALGARPFLLLRVLVSHEARAVALGMLTGIAAVLLPGRAYGSLLYETAASDSAVLIGACLVMVLGVATACVVAVAAAFRYDPAEMLRN